MTQPTPLAASAPLSLPLLQPGADAVAQSAVEAEPEATGLSGLPVHDLAELLPHHEPPPLKPGRCRIVLIRHGQPHIALSPRTGRAGFAAYIEDYEAAGLHPDSVPPAELIALLAEIGRALGQVFCSDRPRARQSAAKLLPRSERIEDALFAEAPLAAPPIPLIKLKVPKWAVISRAIWHLGYHPGIEAPPAARARARAAAKRLTERAGSHGAAVLVAHGYFNFLIGRTLAKQGFKRTGSHRATFWNSVVYDRG